jgi:DNA-binding transcriptional MocR family regulator
MSVWRQVAQIIAGRIAGGTYARERLMPSAKQFAQGFEVSDGTMRHALAVLKDRGRDRDRERARQLAGVISRRLDSSWRGRVTGILGPSVAVQLGQGCR